jgi:hypothetical protein
LRGRRDISSDDVVTGPQQSWQPGTHSNDGICCRRKRIFWLLQLIEAFPKEKSDEILPHLSPIGQRHRAEPCSSSAPASMLRKVFQTPKAGKTT